jgi:hypothetical protein
VLNHDIEQLIQLHDVLRQVAAHGTILILDEVIDNLAVIAGSELLNLAERADTGIDDPPFVDVSAPNKSGFIKSRSNVSACLFHGGGDCRGGRVRLVCTRDAYAHALEALIQDVELVEPVLEVVLKMIGSGNASASIGESAHVDGDIVQAGSRSPNFVEAAEQVVRHSPATADGLSYFVASVLEAENVPRVQSKLDRRRGVRDLRDELIPSRAGGCNETFE